MDIKPIKTESGYRAILREIASLDDSQTRCALIEQLASSRQGSQVEVIRRSVRIVVANEPSPALTPRAVIEYCRAHPTPRDQDETAQVIAALRKQRYEDDLNRTGEHT